MRLTVFLALIATPAMADPGHISNVAGHDHWVAGIAVGAAVAISLWGILKERKRRGKPAGPAKARKGKRKQKPQEA